MGIKEGLDLLWNKIEERFNKVAPAFRYFDINNNGIIWFNEFEIGIHRLGIKMNRELAKKLFEYIDTDLDGNIQYNEFWELCEEARRGIDPYRFNKTSFRGGSEVKSLSNRDGDFISTGSFNGAQTDNEIISSSLASYKRKQKQQRVLPSDSNYSFTYGIKTPAPDSINSVMMYEPLNDYMRQSKDREDKLKNQKIPRHIFKKAKPTASSVKRDEELFHQREERNHKFLAQHLGYLRMKQLEKNKQLKSKYILNIIDLGITIENSNTIDLKNKNLSLKSPITNMKNVKIKVKTKDQKEDQISKEIDTKQIYKSIK